MSFLLPVAIFFGCSLINVILQTARHLLTTTANKATVIAINMITFGFYAVIVKQISSFSMPISIAVTIITNLFGVWIALNLVDRFSKAKLWKICATVYSQEEKHYLASSLANLSVDFNYYQADNNNQLGVVCFDIYSKSHKESREVREALEEIICNYHVVEINRNL